MTPQQSDLSLRNLVVKDTLACRGTISAVELEANDVAMNTLRVLKKATFPPGTIPTPAPVPPPTPGSLILQGDLTVDGNTTLNTLTVTGSLFVGPPGSSTEMLYVSKAGNDTTGTGALFTPFLTIQRAMTAITDSAQTKMYSVVCGPGVYNDNFAIKPWTNLGGTPSASGYEGVVQIGSSCVITLDTSWAGNTYNVGWFTHMTFNNTPTFAALPVNAQLTFFACTFNAGASFASAHSGNVNNITLAACLVYGSLSVTDCQSLFLFKGTATYNGTTTVTSTIPSQTTTLVPLGCEISNALSFVTSGGSGAIGDMRGCGVVGTLSLNGSACSYTATVEGYVAPSNISFAGGASAASNLHYYTFANGLGYTPTTLANWSGTSPVTVQAALDRIAAKITPIP